MASASQCWADGVSRPLTSTRAAVRLPISGGSGLDIFNGRVPRSSLPTTDCSLNGKNGDFDPAVDRFLDVSKFPSQTAIRGIGNSTRYNPKLREFPNFNENISVAKLFHFFGERARARNPG